jgi:FkbM family methyltransferase
LIIYDFGSNNGDDLEYYLKYANLVVAVEADPHLARAIRERYADQILVGRLAVENCVVSEETPLSSEVPFYLRKPDRSNSHLLNQFPEPSKDVIDQYERVLLPARSSVEIIRQYGEPYYVKIDIEHYDHVVLNAMLRADIRPPYISAESHSIDVFCIIVAMGYSSFKLVDGSSVNSLYGDCIVRAPHGDEAFSFGDHSAGPFGNDIRGKWIGKRRFAAYVADVGLGWKDIHASLIDPPEEHYPVEQDIPWRLLAWKLVNHFPRMMLNLKRVRAISRRKSAPLGRSGMDDRSTPLRTK